MQFAAMQFAALLFEDGRQLQQAPEGFVAPAELVQDRRAPMQEPGVVGARGLERLEICVNIADNEMRHVYILLMPRA